MLSKDERKTLRDLATQVAQITGLPEQERRRTRWVRHNDLLGERPLVTINQVCWNEMSVDDTLQTRVSDPYWVDVEAEMRRTIYRWTHMPVDMVVDPYIALPRPLIDTSWGLDYATTRRSDDPTNNISSIHYDNLIRGTGDIDKLHTPVIRLDARAQERIGEDAEQVFTGIIPYRFTVECMHVGLWDWISQWMGVENCYLELMDRPEMMHALMEKLTQGVLSMIDQMESQGLFDANTHMCHCSYTYSDRLPGPDFDESRVRARDVWAFGLAQLFTAVSPEITDAFEIPYMQRIFPRFGAIYYGCCEKLEDRLEILRKLPGVRKISCSAWNDKERFAEALPKGVIMSSKPSPALLATESFDEEAVRNDLRATIAAARRYGHPLEFLQKDISTVRYDPRRLWRWGQIAIEECQNA